MFDRVVIAGLLTLGPLATLAVEDASWAAWVGWAVFGALFITGAAHTVLTVVRKRARLARPGERDDVGRGFWYWGTVWFRDAPRRRGSDRTD